MPELHESGAWNVYSTGRGFLGGESRASAGGSQFDQAVSNAMSGSGMAPGKKLEQIARKAVVAAINTVMAEIAMRSQQEVPKDDEKGQEKSIERHGTTLAESMHFKRATVKDPQAVLAYVSPAAVAQEVGHMTYHHWRGSVVDWVAQKYTTEGTKHRYLSDPFKAAIPRFQVEVDKEMDKYLAANLGRNA